MIEWRIVFKDGRTAVKKLSPFTEIKFGNSQIISWENSQMTKSIYQIKTKERSYQWKQQTSLKS